MIPEFLSLPLIAYTPSKENELSLSIGKTIEQHLIINLSIRFSLWLGTTKVTTNQFVESLLEGEGNFPPNQQLRACMCTYVCTRAHVAVGTVRLPLVKVRGWLASAKYCVNSPSRDGGSTTVREPAFLAADRALSNGGKIL